jgi:integrase
VAEGINPKDRVADRKNLSFGECASDFIQTMRPSWRNQKHIAQWEMTLRKYAAALWPLRVDEITPDDVLAVLKPIWCDKPETASRLRGRIERVLDAARVLGIRNGDNPARWRGLLDHLLPKRQKLTRGHHAAMPYSRISAFIGDLRARSSTAALALEFTILTAARTNEVLGARWDEVNFERREWTVPPSRMKAGRVHRVPLSERALTIAGLMNEIRTSDFVFPGQKAQRPLSNMSLEMMLRRMRITDATVHGFRSTFRDWAAERSTYPNEVCEAALAHAIKDKAEAAYRRGDLMEKRRALMDAWADYCATPPAGNVIAFKQTLSAV